MPTDPDDDRVDDPDRRHPMIPDDDDVVPGCEPYPGRDGPQDDGKD